MSTLCLYWREVSAGQLAEVLRATLPATGVEYAILEWWNALAQMTMATEAVESIANKEDDLLSGSLFGTRAEVRWRRVPADYGLQRPADRLGKCPLFWLAATAEGRLPLGEDWQEDQTMTVRGHGFLASSYSVVLWGSQYHSDGDVWTELSVPRALSYPITPTVGSAEGVLLQVREYRDAGGSIVAARRVGLQATVKR